MSMLIGARRALLGSGADTIAPTVVITSSESSPTAVSPIPITITFSETVSGFVVGDITISGGSLSNFATADNIIFTVDWTPGAIGTFTMDAAAAICQDLAGNDNEAATQFSIFETTVTAPAITPTLGDELLTNPGFEGTYDDESGGAGFIMVAPNWSQYNCETDGTDLLSKDAATIHGGSASQKISVNLTGEGVVSDNSSILTGWYQLFAWFNVTSGGGGWFQNSGAKFGMSKKTTGTGSWQQLIATDICKTSGPEGLMLRAGNGVTVFYVDDASFKPLTFTSLRTSVGASTVKDGTYLCHPTVAAGTVTGMLVEYLNDNYWVAVVVHRAGASDTAKLISCINGILVEARSGTITYGAAGELKCVVSGTTHQLFYSDVQVGADATIDNTGMGVGVYAFNTYAGNTVGGVTSNP